MRSQDVSYKDGNVRLTGFLVWDDTCADARPGILVVHGGAGLDEHARNRAQRIADAGFVAFACDMYGDGVAGDRQRVVARIEELRGTPGRLCQRAQAGLSELASHPKVDGRMAAVGYCFGGMTVLELARAGTNLIGVVSVHGSLATSRPARPDAVVAKVLVCHGALDPHVPLTHVNGFIEEMNSARADWQLVVYGNAMHGFTHEHAAAHPTPGVAYDAAADARSWIAIQTFFDELFAHRTPRR
jgi:dienelactone hydrolase